MSVFQGYCRRLARASNIFNVDLRRTRQQRMFCVALFLTLLLFALSNVSQAQLRIGVLGDSLSAGDGSANGEYPNWITQLANSGGFTIPTNANQAQDGAVSSEVLNYQIPAYSSVVHSGALDYSVLMVGGNDGVNAAYNYFTTNDLGVFQTFITNTTSNIENILTKTAQAGSVRQILANVPDVTVTPAAQEVFANFNIPASVVQVASDAIHSINLQIGAFALAHGIPVIDMEGAMHAIFTNPPLEIAGNTFTDLFPADGFHPGPVVHGLIANMAVSAMNQAYGENASPLSDQQIVTNLGEVPAPGGPTFFDVSPYVFIPPPDQVPLPFPEPEPVTISALTNGDFETGNFSGWTLGGNTGFTSVSGGVGHAGQFAASLGATGTLNSLMQTIETLPGQEYEVEFWLRNEGGTPNQFRAVFDGQVLFDQSNLPGQPYTKYSYLVTASSNSALLEFNSRNDPSFFRLDDIRVNAVPEPATFVLMSLGAVGLWAFARGSRKGG